jgi:hypothetical protein
MDRDGHDRPWRCRDWGALMAGGEQKRPAERRNGAAAAHGVGKRRGVAIELRARRVRCARTRTNHNDSNQKKSS